MSEAIAFLKAHKVAVFIVAYQAEKHIFEVLSRIPLEIRDQFAEIFMVDDSSEDTTIAAAKLAKATLNLENFNIFKTPYNRGYGGNQKLGYLYAQRKKYEYVILLHGDGQYAPEIIPEIVQSLAKSDADAVFASRMKTKVGALKGGMPLYKWLGNQLLTAFQNYVLGTNLSEFHSGYRAYRVSALSELPFLFNSDGFHFDTEIVIQLSATGKNILEIAAPTHYGDQICRVNGLSYALNCCRAVIKYRLVQWGLLYETNFDFKLFENPEGSLKKAASSLHQNVLNFSWKSDWSVAELGANQGEISALLAEKVKTVTCVDLEKPRAAGRAVAEAVDLNSDFSEFLGIKSYDCVLALDVIEHLHRPEKSVANISKTLKKGGLLLASTGNVAFYVTRFGLLFSQFNYGKRGILDLTHTRLFTIKSFKKLISQSGFKIHSVEFFGPPILDRIGKSIAFRFLDKASAFLAKFWPSLFAFQFLIVAEKMDDVEEIFAVTFHQRHGPETDLSLRLPEIGLEPDLHP